MLSRRRIDWEVILGPQTGAPAWGDHAAPSELVALLPAFQELFTVDDPDAILRRAVELALSKVGLVRAGIYLYDEPVDLMLGTWGTDLDGAVVDEHHSMFRAGEDGRRVFARAASGEAHWTLVENCPLIDNREKETRVIGRAWVVCTPIRSARRPLGMMYNDPGLTGAAVDPDKQTRAAVLCALVGALLESRAGGDGADRVARVSARHPVVAKAVRMLAQDPSLGGGEMAARLNMSLSRFARLFKSMLGLSLVDYRNQLRLERFMQMMESGATNMLEAALAAGFGSYAQFHRVFHAMRGKSPRAYLGTRTATRPRPPTGNGTGTA
jgi:AraC-like DNA-binding protein